MGLLKGEKIIRSIAGFPIGRIKDEVVTGPFGGSHISTQGFRTVENPDGSGTITDMGGFPVAKISKDGKSIDNMFGQSLYRIEEDE